MNDPKTQTIIQFTDGQVNILKDSYIKVSEQSYNYGKIFISVSYAAFFGVWVNAQNLISKSAKRFSLLALLLSVILYVIWDVIKMFYSHHRLSRVFVATGDSGEKFINEFNTYNMSIIRLNKNVYPIFLWPTIAFAIIGIGILLFGLIFSLF